MVSSRDTRQAVVVGNSWHGGHWRRCGCGTMRCRGGNVERETGQHYRDCRHGESFTYPQLMQTFIVLMVILEHLRSLRPSQLPALYLLITCLFLGARVRTAALIPLPIIPLGLSLAARFALFILLQLSTRASLSNPDVPPGATSGLVSRYLIAWVLPLLWRGFRSPLTLRDLGEIDTSLHTTATWAAFEPQ